MPTNDLEERVHSNLQNALDNEYDVRHWDVDDIVTDLMCFASELEDEDPEDLKPHVISWLAKARNPQ
jgi:hypothetical protein